MANKRDENYREVYANACGAMMSPADCRIAVGDMTGDQEAPVLEKVVVILPPWVAKGLTQQLMQAIGRYEQEFGIIQAPQRREPKAPEGPTPAEAAVKQEAVNRKNRRAQTAQNRKNGGKPNGMDSKNEEGPDAAGAPGQPKGRSRKA